MSLSYSSSSSISFHCIQCSTQSNLHTFPCTHTYCRNCIVENYQLIFQDFYSMLEQDPNFLSGKFSQLGCIKNCEKGKQSLSISKILLFLQHSTVLSDLIKKQFSENLALGRSFFSGIRTYFFRCAKCQKIRSSSLANPFVCKDCIFEICFQQMQSRPSDVIIEWTIKESDFHKRDYLMEYVLIKGNRENEFYEVDNSQENIFKIPKERGSQREKYCLLVRAIILSYSNDWVLVEDLENTFQVVSKVIIIN